MNATPETNIEDREPAHTPRRVGLAENFRLLFKLVAGSALVGAALWGVDLWVSAP